MTSLSLLELNPRSSACRRDMTDPQAMHKTLMSMFPASPGRSARRDFGILWRVEPGPAPTVLLQSATCPDFSALPAKHGAFQSKSLDAHLASLSAGGTIRYRTVLNPVRTNRRSHKERRVVIPSRDRPQWWSDLAGKAGMRLEDHPTMTGQADRSIARGGVRFPIYTVRVDGTATIDDPAMLTDAIIAGIGRAKAWGCGLLTVVRLAHSQKSKL